MKKPNAIAFLFLLLASLLALPACRSRDRGSSAPESSLPTSAPALAAGRDSSPAPAPRVGEVVTTQSGLKYEVLKVGNGIRPKAWDRVKVHYQGYFPNGTVFDSSVQRGEPAVFGLNQVIPGWTEGVQYMPEGSRFRFYIPWLLAYGIQGSPPKIPPKQDLMFDIELIEVLR